MPLFNTECNGEKKNVNVPNLSGTNPPAYASTHTHARADAAAPPVPPALDRPEPVPVSPTPAECGIASMEAVPVLAPVVASAAAAPSVPAGATTPADGIDPELAGLTADQLRDLIDALTVQIDGMKGDRRGDVVGAMCVLIGRRMTARQLLAALGSPGLPPPTPKVESISPKPAAAPAPPPRPSMQTLIDRLARVAGPGPVEEFAQQIARDLDDARSLAYYRQLGRDIQARQIAARRVWDAYCQARNGQRKGTARSPGAIFTSYVRQLE